MWLNENAGEMLVKAGWLRDVISGQLKWIMLSS